MSKVQDLRFSGGDAEESRFWDVMACNIQSNPVKKSFKGPED
jgi:hypothetical protein